MLAEHASRAEDRICRRWRFKLYVWPEMREQNRIKSKVRSRVEHAFGTLKLRFGFVKVCYCGLRKNLRRLHVGFALVNLLTAQRLLAAAGQLCARIGQNTSCSEQPKCKSQQTRSKIKAPETGT